jgi:hypothetical protein
MISSFTLLLEKRKSKLKTYLNNNMDELSLEKQHQLFGAIAEIENMVESLNNLRKAEIENEKNPNEIFLFTPIYGKGVIKDILDFVRDLF